MSRGSAAGLGDAFGDLLLNALKGAVYAAAVGSVLGYLASEAVRRAHRSGRARPASPRMTGLALPFLIYAASVLVEGNGFVAAFVAGLWYATTVSAVGGDSLDPVQDASRLPALAAWYAFGAPAAEAFSDGIALQVLAYALLVLTVARFVPVVASLTGTAFTRAERSAIGWLGPRGVTSIVFAVLAYVQLPPEQADFVVNVTAATVLLSVVLHGVTAEPIARWFARHPRPEQRPSPPAPDGELCARHRPGEPLGEVREGRRPPPRSVSPYRPTRGRGPGAPRHGRPARAGAGDELVSSAGPASRGGAAAGGPGSEAGRAGVRPRRGGRRSPRRRPCRRCRSPRCPCCPWG